MSEIWNLSALCRCCLTDGHFKSLELPYTNNGCVEIYSAILRDTFNITILPPALEASYTICNECINQLRSSAKFKQQVLECERKFQEYCKNEQGLDPTEVKLEMDLEDHEMEDDNKNLLNFSEVGLKQDDFDYDNDDNHSVSSIKCEVENMKHEENSGEDCKEIKKEFKKKISRIKKSKNNKKKTPRGTKPLPDPSYEVVLKTESGEFYSCKTCGGNYDELKKLHVHILHNHMYYTCDICQKQFLQKYSYNRHLKRHDDSQIKCGYCGKMFPTKSTLVEHQTTHNIKYKCDICKKDFGYKSSLKQHLKWHSGLTKKFMCDICGHSFNDKTNLRYHVRCVHEKQRPFQCNLCPKTFTAKKHLIVHLRSHSGERPYKCEVCLKDFVSSDRLKRHKSLHDSEFRYQCVVCNLQLNDRGKFNAHVRSHVGNLPYRCEYCVKDFSCKYSMRRHMISDHEGVRYPCDLCGKKFTQKSQVDRHKKNVHDPNKPTVPKEKCELCKKMVFDLERHSRTHLERKFSCQFCNKCYAEKKGLNRHVQISHLGRKTFSCDMCSKKYTKAINLNKHKMKVHNTALKIEMEDNFDEALASYTLHNKNINTEVL